MILKNKIPTKILDELTAYYLDSIELPPLNEHNSNMRLKSPWYKGPAKELLTPILEPYLNIEHNLGDNYFCHTGSYLIHSDSFDGEESFNVLIPLKLWNPIATQHYVIFDQYATTNVGIVYEETKRRANCTNSTMLPYPVTKEHVNFITYENMDQDFYDSFLEDSFRPIEMYWGLSGTAYPWVPGDIGLFNSSQFHCTGKMVCDKKLGLSLRFRK